MESLPGYDNWKTTPPDEPETELLLHEIVGGAISRVAEASADGDEEFNIGCDETFQSLTIRLGLLPREPAEALFEAKERLKKILQVLEARTATPKPR